MAIYLVSFLFLQWRRRRNIALVFAKHRFEEPSLKTIENILNPINQSSNIQFWVKRIANILYKDQEVSLVYGPVGFPAWAGRFSPIQRVYAVADMNQSEWMQSNTDVFELAVKGSDFSVFWVNISKLKPRVN